MKTLTLMLLILPFVASCATPNKAELDDEVRRLCAVDGGIKVYETARLPEQLRDKSGVLRIPMKKDAQQGDAFYYEWELQRLRKGNPENGEADLARSHFKIYRTVDNKLIGESIAYTRRGGDVSGPWHPSHSTCPSNSGLVALQNRLFVVK